MSQHQKILIVNSRKDNRHMIANYLDNQGLRCVLANTGDQSLEKLTITQPDLILLSLSLDDTSGIQICKTIRQTHLASLLPIIMVTPSDHRRDVLPSLKAGANDYISTPFSPEILYARIQAQLTQAQQHKTLNSAYREKTQLLAHISKELRTPLNTIIGYTEMLLEEIDQTNEQGECLTKIYRSGQQIHVLFEEIIKITNR